MSRPDRFPDVGEFRTRLKGMGFSTGADDREGAAKAAPRLRIPSPSGVGALWTSLGFGATAVLAWLVVDLGGPVPMVTALVEPGTSQSGVALFRTEIRRALAEAGANGLVADPVQLAENAALRRRVAMLEDMLTGAGPLQDGMAIANLPTYSRDAGGTQFESSPRAGLPPKGDARPPTAPLRGIGPPETVAAIPLTADPAAHRSQLAPEVRFGLDLGAYESIAVMKDRWNMIEGRHRDILDGLKPQRVTEYGADGRSAHRLVAGPVMDPLRVAELCAALRSRAVPCRRTISAGEPL